MVDAALGRARLVAQGLVAQRFARPADVVSAFGAHQGQDLPGVLASVALRTRDTSVEAVVDAFARGEIVRGYPMRGTVFALPGGDARWITELCVAPGLREAERLLRVNRPYTDDDLDRAVGCLHDVLAHGPRPRTELHAAWDRAGLMAPQGAGYHLLRHQVMRGAAVLGPIVDGDQQVALASTWLPPGSGLEDRFNGDRDAATAELLRRYLTSHGPATLRDFAWWTKLPLGQVRRAAALIRDQVDQVDQERFQRPGLADEIRKAGRAASRPLLLPGFDEFLLGYQDRLFAVTEDHHRRLVPGNNGMFQKSAVSGGRVVGLWKRGGAAGRRHLDLTELEPLAPRTRARFDTLFETFPFHTP